MEPNIRRLDSMRNVMRLKHMSLRMEEAYVVWVCLAPSRLLSLLQTSPWPIFKAIARRMGRR